MGEEATRNRAGEVVQTQPAQLQDGEKRGERTGPEGVAGANLTGPSKEVVVRGRGTRRPGKGDGHR